MLYISLTSQQLFTNLTLGDVIDDTTLWKYNIYVTEHGLKLQPTIFE